MRNQRWLAPGALLGVLALTGVVHSQRPDGQQQPPPKERVEKLPVKPEAKAAKPVSDTLAGRLAGGAQLTEEQANKLLTALGPAIRDELRQGRTVNIPGLGTFRVVKIPEHKDMQNGRPVTVPSSNYVEFLPTGEIVDAANSPGARPAETVPPFQYNVLPNQTPGQKSPRIYTPSTRIR